MNEIAQNFLASYADGREVYGGWKFAKALQQARLDYSEASLHRLDQLLAAVRERAKPSRQELRESVPGRNFCSLIAYYLIEVVRRRTGAQIDWQDRASALRVLPAGAPPPEAPLARLLAHAVDQGVAFTPLAWVEASVLGENREATAGNYVASLVAQLERDGPPVWWTGMHALGRIASAQMMMAADGGVVLPMMLSSTAPLCWNMLMVSTIEVSEALTHGARALDENPDGATWQVLAYDGLADLKDGRLDAVMVVLNTYGKSPLRLTLAFPYRPATATRVFEILDPALREANVDNETVALLGGAMQRGIQSVKWAFETTWDQLRKAAPPSGPCKT